MVYIVSWDDFVERSVQLFRNSPQNTRYVMKYRHSDGKLVLKVTDDKEILMENYYLGLHVMFNVKMFVFVLELVL
ncbi:putative signal recognition particle, SRP9/SRP14 subunit, signal recognition particle SRP9 [Helianthus debilis subsp. tardiflorus]